MTILLCLAEQVVGLIVIVTNRPVLARRKPAPGPVLAHTRGRRRAEVRPAFNPPAFQLDTLVAARGGHDGLHRVRGHVKPEREQAEPGDQRMDEQSSHAVPEMIGGFLSGYRPTLAPGLTEHAERSEADPVPARP